jgi:hypothetical protein
MCLAASCDLASGLLYERMEQDHGQQKLIRRRVCVLPTRERERLTWVLICVSAIVDCSCCLQLLLAVVACSGCLLLAAAVEREKEAIV